MKQDVVMGENPQKTSYVITRRLYPYESMIEYLCTLLTSSTFFVKLSISLGVSDAVTAIIGTIGSFVCLFQLISGRIARYTPIKPWLIPITIVTRLSMVAMFLLPFLNAKNVAEWLLLILMFLAQTTMTIVAPIKQNVFLSSVEEEERVRYLAGHRVVSLVFGAPIVLFGGFFLNYMEKNRQLKMGYLYIAILLFVLGILHILTLVLSKEPPTKTSEHKNVFADFGALLKNKEFRSLFIILVLHQMAIGILSPFTETYVQREMGFSISVLGMISALSITLFSVGLIVVRKFGQKLKPATGRTILFVAYIAYDLIWLTMTRENGIVVYIFICLASGVINAMNVISYVPLIFQTVKEQERTSALALAGGATGVFSFLTTLVISPFFHWMQNSGVVLFGISFYAQQVLAVISALVRVFILILWLVLCKNLRGAKSASTTSIEM